MLTKIEAILLKIKLRFRPKNVKGRGFFAVFRSALEHFGIWLFDSNDDQTYELVVRLKSKFAAKVKKIEIIAKKNCLSGQKRQKLGFWGFHVCTKTLGIFTVGFRWLQISCNNRSIRFPTCWNNKKACLREKIIWYQKTSKIVFFSGVFKFYINTLRSLIACLRWRSNSQVIHLMRSARFCNIKKGNFIEEQIAFHAKNLQKKVFWEFQTMHH